VTEHLTGHWLDLADTIARDIGSEPVTFLLGAGASMSSGAPSLEKLERRWMDSDAAAYPSRKKLFEKISTRTDPQKINPIRSLFDDVRPYIGYHCLAALSVDRPIFVLNLNWDDALEQACAAVGVEFRHMTVDRKGDLVFPVEESGRVTRVHGEEYGKEPPVLNEKPKPGVYCLQVHGKLGDSTSGIRIGTYDTLQFTPIVKQTIINKFFCHPTIIVGASLQGEFDIVDLLRQLTQDHVKVPRVLTPIYVFSRQEKRTTDPTDKLTQHVLYTRSSDSNFRGDPAVDFDHLLLELATKLKGDDFQAPFRPTTIPSLEEIALPSPRVLGPPFHPTNHRLVVVEGDARVGRTIAAGLLAHVARICDAETPSIEVHPGPARCATALEELNSAASTESRVLILDNPFGTTGAFRENKRFAKAMSKYMTGSGRSRVIVTTRASSWRLALAESKVKAPEQVISVAVDDWYHSDELSAYLESKVDLRDRPLLRREIHKGELATPTAIDVAVFGGRDPRTEMIKEKVEFLRAISPDAAWCAILARLQELWPNGVADLPLHSASDQKSPAFAEAQLMLRCVELDGEQYVVPAHSTDREALDCFFSEHFGDFEERLDELGRKHGSPRGACELWRAIQDLRAGRVGRLQRLPEEVRLNWGATLLEEAARDPNRPLAIKRFNKIRNVLLKDGQHFWSMREVVFETIRLWPTLKNDPAAYKFLSDVLNDKKVVGKLDSAARMGRYLVLEAMLYVQAATYPGTWDMDAYTRVWDMLSVERHSLLDDPEANARELALMFDAFTWCPPRLGPEELRRWLRDFSEGAKKCSKLRAAMLCSSLHHPEGFDLLAEQVDELPLQIDGHSFSEEDAEMASFMISWHFVHQSRARALLYRRSLEPAHSYLLHRIPGKLQPALVPALVERCKRVVEQLSQFQEHAGWAIHLAMSIRVQRGGFDPSFAAQHIADLSDGDQGAIAAAMTYEIPPVLRTSFLAYFERRANLDALLDAMSKPHEIDGVTVGPPPFCASRLPWHLYGALEIEWERLEEEGIPVNDARTFLEMLFSTTADLEDEADGPDAWRALHAVAREVASGDLRRLEGLPFRNLSDDGSKMSASEFLADLLANAADEIQRQNP
jgi:hypothetical protein